MEGFKTISSENIYKGKIFKLNKEKIELPNGKKADRDIVVCNGASAIVPIDEDGNLILIRQYRQPMKKSILEIPAGTLEKDEKPLDCAHRELEEEIGYRSNNMKEIGVIYTTPGFTNEKIYIFIARELVESSQNLDEDEFLSIERYSFEKAMNMIKIGEIADSKTIIGILRAKEMLENR